MKKFITLFMCLFLFLGALSPIEARNISQIQTPADVEYYKLGSTVSGSASIEDPNIYILNVTKSTYLNLTTTCKDKGVVVGITDLEDNLYYAEGSYKAGTIQDRVYLKQGTYMVMFMSPVENTTTSFTFKATDSVPVTSIKLNTSSSSLVVGQSYSLKATINPSNATVKTLKWTTSNSKVATVSSTGVVSAKGAGSVTITATSAEGKKASAKFTIYNKGLTAKTGSGYMKYTKQLYFKGASGKISWSSSSKSIATVNSSGKVTMNKPGTVTITAKSGSIVSKCKITVKKPTISASSKTIYTKFSSTLKVTGGSGKATWYSSNKSVATVNSSGKVTAKKAGTTYISVKRNGYTTKCKVTVKSNAAYPKISLNVSKYSKTNAAMVIKRAYYNTSGQLVIDAYLMNNTKYKIHSLKNITLRITDSKGRTVGSQTFYNKSANLSPRKYKAMTFTFSKGNTKIKNAELYKGIKSSMSGSYLYTY